MATSSSKLLRILCFFLLLHLFTLLTPQHSYAKRTVRAGIYDYKPLIYSDTAGTPRGIFVEILDQMAKVEQWDVQYLPGTWQEGLARLKSDEIDLLLCIGYSEERAKTIDFPMEFLLMDWGRIFKANGSSKNTIMDLDNKTVAALRGSVFTAGFKTLAQQFHIDVELLEMDRVSDVLNAVTSGKAVAGVTSNLPSILNEAQFNKVGQTPVIFTPVKIGYGVNKGRNGDLIAALDRSIAGFKADEQSLYHKKLDQMMGIRESGFSKQVYWILSGITVAFAMAVIFIVLLKSQIRRKTRSIVESAEQYHSMLQSTDDGFWRVDREGRLLDVNARYAEFSGYSREELLTMTVAELEAHESADKVLEHIKAVAVKGSALFETSHRRKDGTLWDVEVSVSYIAMTNEVVAFLRDISTRKQMEKMLTESKHRLRALVQSIPDLIWLKDADGVYLFCNREFERFFAAKEADIVGKTGYDFVDRETADSFREHDLKAMAAGAPSSNEEWVIYPDSGERVLLETVKTPMFDNEGRLIGVLGIARNITGRRLAEENSLEMERKFQQTQKLESLGVLAGGIAHDFNNILNIIMGYCYIIIGDIDSGLDQKTVVRKIEASAKRASDLCRQMLTYAGKNISVKSRINLFLMVDDVVKMLRSAIKKNVVIESDLMRDVPQILGDTAQIQQVVMNLIINASEAIGDINGIIRIVLDKTAVQYDQAETDFFGSVIQPGNYVRLTVSDNGCGMDAETQKHVFEPFYTTKFTGRGLGMSAVLGIIKSHDGALRLSSSPGVGTTFEVCFPLPAVPSANSIAPPAGFFTGEAGSGTVLLVDDEEGIRAIGSALMKAMGFSVVTAKNGREALEIYREQGSRIDLILMDLLMPEMGGIETYHLLREMSPALPVVICSGCDIGDIQEGLNGDQYAALIQKPYNPGQLRDALKKLLDKTEAPLI